MCFMSLKNRNKPARKFRVIYYRLIKRLGKRQPRFHHRTKLGRKKILKTYSVSYAYPICKRTAFMYTRTKQESRSSMNGVLNCEQQQRRPRKCVPHGSLNISFARSAVKVISMKKRVTHPVGHLFGNASWPGYWKRRTSKTVLRNMTCGLKLQVMQKLLNMRELFLRTRTAESPKGYIGVSRKRWSHWDNE